MINPSLLIVSHIFGDQINPKMGETEKSTEDGFAWILFKLGQVLSVIGILFFLFGMAASMALIILYT